MYRLRMRQFSNFNPLKDILNGCINVIWNIEMIQWFFNWSSVSFSMTNFFNIFVLLCRIGGKWLSQLTCCDGSFYVYPLLNHMDDSCFPINNNMKKNKQLIYLHMYKEIINHSSQRASVISCIVHVFLSRSITFHQNLPRPLRLTIT